MASRHSVFALISIFNKYNCDITYLFRFFIYFALCFHYYEFEFYSFLLCVSFIEEILCVVRVFFVFHMKSVIYKGASGGVATNYIKAKQKERKIEKFFFLFLSFHVHIYKYNFLFHSAVLCVLFVPGSFMVMSLWRRIRFGLDTQNLICI